MGIIECLDKETGKVWTAVYAKGPHMGLVAENLDDVKEQISIVAEGDVRVSGVSLEEIPRLSELESGFGVDPIEYAKLIGMGVVEAAKGKL